MNPILDQQTGHALNKPAVGNGCPPASDGEPLGAPATAAQARLTLGQGWAVYLGTVQQNHVHSHHVLQIACASGQPIRMTTDAGEVEAAGHVVASAVPHQLHTQEPLVLLFLDPALHASQRWSQYADRGVRAMTVEQAQRLVACVKAWQTRSADTVARAHPRSDRDASLMAWLHGHLQEPVRAKDAASYIGLSESHFLHWFTDSHGMPFRPYLRWLRLQRVLRILSGGATLTAAAHEAGFADSAHLSRTFMATFGVSPSHLHRATIEVCDTSGPDVSAVLEPVWPTP